MKIFSKPYLIVATTYAGIYTACLLISDFILRARFSLLHPGVLLTTVIPIATVSTLLWFRGVTAKSTTIKHGGFVGFYAVIICFLNPATWLLIAYSLGLMLFLSMTLLPLLGYWIGKEIEQEFPELSLTACK